MSEPLIPLPPDEPYRRRYPRTYVVTIEAWDEGDLPTPEQVADLLRDGTTARVEVEEKP